MRLIVQRRSAAVRYDWRRPSSHAPTGTQTASEGIVAGSTLRQYANAVRTASIPGPHVHAYVARFRGPAPVDLVARLYEDLFRNFQYQSDPIVHNSKGNPVDVIYPAEYLLGATTLLAGDCDDFAVVLLAALAAIDIDCRMVLVEPTEEGQPGHAFTEVKLAPAGRRDLVQPISQHLCQRWQAGKLPLNSDHEGIWLSLDGGIPPKAPAGRRSFYLHTDGTHQRLKAGSS